MLLTQLPQDKIAALLSSQTIDASKGVLFKTGGSIAPNTVNRTILIGLGGTGVKTLDYVKGAIISKLQPTWNRYVGFLGIDTDFNEFERASFLEPGEYEGITTTSVGIHGTTAPSRTIAQRRLVPNEKTLTGINGNGAGRKREIGTFKLRDQEPGQPGVDEKIVTHIQNLASVTLAPLAPGAVGRYEVYVIGSVCGGTCSGAFLAMPALIEKALHGKNYRARAILYLPDTLSSLDPANKSELFANGYASLKELDYFAGETMREGYQDTWGFNNAASPELSLPVMGSPNPLFYQIPYLVGSQNPGAPTAAADARHMISEYLISLLGQMQSNDPDVFSVESHFDNAQHHIEERAFLDPIAHDAEAEGENHDRPRHYAAIGYAEASAPQKILRAYTLSETCRRAGLKPLSPADRATALAGGLSFLPFRGEDDLLSASDGTNQSKAILEPLKNLMAQIHSGSFSMLENLSLSEQPTWFDIREGKCDGYAAQIDNYVVNSTTPAVNEQLGRQIQNAYLQYREKAVEYVKKEGPLAFFNLFKGRFNPNGADYGVGIEKMLQQMMAGKVINVNGEAVEYKGWIPVTTAKQTLDDIKSAIVDKGAGILGMVKIATPTQQNQAASWVAAYEQHVKSRINEKRREYALGANGMIARAILEPAKLMADNLRTFGYVLSAVSDIYGSFGDKMVSFQAFQNARDGVTEVNIAAVQPSTYNWIKNQADETIASINAMEFRDHLIDDFMNNTQAWLEVPQNTVETNSTTGEVKLIREDVPVAARTVFDQFAAEELPPLMNVSIQAMFDQLNTSGTNYAATATGVVQSLAAGSGVQINGSVSPNFIVAVYPQSLLVAGGSGPQIAQAIEHAFQLQFNGRALQVFSSADTDTIRCYQLAAPFELYRLHDLTEWEKEYEAALNNANPAVETVSRGVESMLHCMSPAAEGVVGQVFRDVMPWEDYPAVTLQKRDPRIQDPVTGYVSREGKMRIALDAVIEEAKKLGVLYCEHGTNGFLVKRVHLHRRAEGWNFDLTMCPADSLTGMLPLGKGLAETVAAQNGVSLSQITKGVVLNEGGIFAGPAPTEAQAWSNAARVLRAHVPMYREILVTLEKFRVWAQAIIEYNHGVMQRFRPAQFIWMLRSLLVYQREDNHMWVLKMPTGNEQVLANLSPMMLKFLPPVDKKFIDNGLLFYYLFRKVDQVLAGDKLNERFDAAKARYNEFLLNMMEDELTHGQTLSAAVEAERQALLEKGMDPEGADKVGMKFQKGMQALALPDTELEKIQQFYFRTSLADLI